MRDDFRSIMENYEVNIRQTPQYACAATLLDTTCHYLQPPPIVEIRQVSGSATKRLSSPDQHLLMSIALVDESTGLEVSSYCNADGNQQPYLSGSVVSPTHEVRAEAGVDVKVFLFPEVKVWVAGHFKLKFSLFEKFNETMQLCHVALSSAFNCFQNDIYPGKFPPTPLDVTLATQNVRQRVFKQPLIRRPKEQEFKNAPSSSKVLVGNDPEIEIQGLPRPPQLHKIQAKGQARKRYAASTPASRCFVFETTPRELRPGSQLSKSDPIRPATQLSGSRRERHALRHDKPETITLPIGNFDSRIPSWLSKDGPGFSHSRSIPPVNNQLVSNPLRLPRIADATHRTTEPSERPGFRVEAECSSPLSMGTLPFHSTKQDQGYGKDAISGEQSEDVGMTCVVRNHLSQSIASFRQPEGSARDDKGSKSSNGKMSLRNLMT